MKLCLDLPDDPLERLHRELVLLGHPLGAEGGAEENVEEQSGVDLCLSGELVVSLYYHQLLAQRPDILYHLGKVRKMIEGRGGRNSLELQY